GLALSRNDLPLLATSGLDMILIPAGLALSESDVTYATGCAAQNLNRFAAQGAIGPISHRLAPLIRGFIAAISDPPIEALACQNDVYQYHLRLQFYFLVTLEAALESFPDPVLVLATPAYLAYWSPMRPEL